MRILTILLMLALTCVVQGQIITSGLVVRLESDVGVTQSGGNVTSWNDQSGLGNHLTGYDSPKIGLVTTPSTLPSITLIGTSGKLERATSSGLPLAASDRSIFVVAKYNSTTWWAGTAYGNGADNQAFGILLRHPTGELVLQGFGGANDLVSSTLMFGTGFSTQCGIVSGNTATLYKDGVSVASFTHAYNTAGSKFVIGQEIAGAGYVGMDVACVLIYNRALSTTERQQVESYLTDKYFNLGSPPVISPFQISNLRAGSQSNIFRFGDTINFSASASDVEDGTLNGSSFSWKISYVSPVSGSTVVYGPVSNVTSISFPIQQAREFLGNFFYQCDLTVTDSSGLSATASYNILPQKSQITIQSSPQGIPIQVAGQAPSTTPFVFSGLVDYGYSLSTPVEYCLSLTKYQFGSWSIGGSASTSYVIPPSSATVTASYANLGSCVPPPDASGVTLYTNVAENTVTISWPYSPNTWPLVVYPDIESYPHFTLDFGQPDKSVAQTVSNGYAYITTWATQPFFSARHFYISNCFNYTISWPAHTNASFYEIFYCPSGPWALCYSVGEIPTNQTSYTFNRLDMGDRLPWNFYVYKRIDVSPDFSGWQIEIKRETVTAGPQPVQNRPPSLVSK